jgi:lipooligosaccharide transport system ATP-binding protein
MTTSVQHDAAAGIPVVSARGLTKRFGGQQAVNGIAFDLYPGRCFGFVGPNGAGKTTTLRMTMGLTPTSSGTLSVFGLPVTGNASAIRARVGIVPQADNLDPDFSVEENLYMYASYFGLSRGQVKSRIEGLLAFVSLTDRRALKTDTLSGGMQRRLTIARALVNYGRRDHFISSCKGLENIEEVVPAAFSPDSTRRVAYIEQGTILRS